MKNLFIIINIFLLLSPLYPKSWHFESIHIKASVKPDGSMHVNEARTYNFRGKFSWADYQLSGLQNQQILDFKLSDNNQTYLENYSEDIGSYSIEEAGNLFYLKWHYNAKNEIKTFYLDYTISNVIKTYDDVAELYWKFIGESNPAGVDTVSIEVALPQKASFGDVKAWAHGPLWGNVMFKHDKILLTVGQLQAKQYVEARVVFPPEWTPGSIIIAGNQERKILAEEKTFAEQANRDRQQALIDEEIRKENNARAYNIAMPMATVVVILFIFMYWRYGRGFDVNYDQKIDANIPNDKHPALLNCIYFNNNVTGSTLSASLFYLAQKGLIKIEKDETYVKKWYDSSDRVILKLDREKWKEQKIDMQDFENDLLDFLFDGVAKGESEVTSKMMKKASSKMQKWFRKWQKMVKAHLKNDPYFESESIKGSVICAVLSLIGVGISIYVLINLGQNGLISLVPSILICILSLTILRYTPDIKYLKLKLNALRRYLKSFGTSAYQESDLHSISDYFLFSIVLGTGKKAVEKLINIVPQDQHAALFPWFIYTGSGGPADFASAINSVVNAAATSVSSAAGAGGGMSGGVGAGGGGAAGGAG